MSLVVKSLWKIDIKTKTNMNFNSWLHFKILTIKTLKIDFSRH